jgi:hypothetical protein
MTDTSITSKIDAIAVLLEDATGLTSAQRQDVSEQARLQRTRDALEEYLRQTAAAIAAAGIGELPSTAADGDFLRYDSGLDAWVADTAALADLSDVGPLTPGTGDVLRYNGTVWTHSAQSGIDHGSLGGLADDDHTQYHNDTRALTWLNTKGITELSDVVITAAADDKFLRHNGSNWVDEAVSVYLKTGDTGTGAHDFGGASSLEIPNGAGGTTVDATGEVCVDSTSKTLNFYDGSSERVLDPDRSKSVTIETPTDADAITVFRCNAAITVTKMVAVIVGGTSAVFTVRHSTDRSATGNEVVTGGTTCSSTTTGTVVTSFNDATIPTDSFVWVDMGTITGTVTQFHVTVFYNRDA